MRRSLLPIALMTLTATWACQDAPEYSPPTDTTATTTDGPATGTTGTVATALAWCQPQPVAYDVGQIPQLPEGVALEGFCEVPAPADLPAGTPTQLHTLHQADRRLEVQIEAGLSPGARQSFRFAPEGWVQEVTAEGSTGFYSTGLGMSEYLLDVRGEMLHKLAVEVPFEGAPEGEWVGVEKEQTWQDGRLLERIERNGEGGDIVRRWTWTWREGRLVEAALSDTSRPAAPRNAVAAFAYHPDGTLAAVERSINGVAVEREAWSFDSDGALTDRTFWGRSADALAAERGGDASDWQLPAGLDDHQRAPLDYQSDPWREAMPIVRGDCQVLPRGPGHGYPDAEPEHQLGVANDGRPAGIGFNYGSDTYGWFYGDLAWYGHDGVGSSWLGAGTGLDPAEVESRVKYDGRGVMIGEDARAVQASGEEVHARRGRHLGEGGAIVQDDLELTVGDATVLRSLRFGRDARGGLLSRELWADGQAAERQTWTRDDQGRALTHALEASSGNHQPLPRFEGAVALFAGFSAGQLTAASWTWRYEAERLVERSGGPNALHQTLRYDDRGRLAEAVGSFTALEPGTEQAWTWDADGRLTLQCQRWADEPMACTRTVYDAAGRLAWRERSLGDDAPQVIDLHTWTCAP